MARIRQADMHLYLSDEEEEMFKRAAERESLTVSAWLRRVGVMEARRTREAPWWREATGRKTSGE